MSYFISKNCPCFFGSPLVYCSCRCLVPKASAKATRLMRLTFSLTLNVGKSMQKQVFQKIVKIKPCFLKTFNFSKICSDYIWKPGLRALCKTFLIDAIIRKLYVSNSMLWIVFSKTKSKMVMCVGFRFVTEDDATIFFFTQFFAPRNVITRFDFKLIKRIFSIQFNYILELKWTS